MPSDISNYSSCYSKIFIGGNEVDPYRVRNIVSLNIVETVSGADLCTIVIHDTEGAYLDDDVFIENVSITVELSEASTGKIHQFNGFIASIDVNFGEFVKMTITCMDNSFLLDREKKERTWEDKSSYDIVSEILSEYGITLQGSVYTDFQVPETSSQSEQTDLDFILSLLNQETVPCYFKIVDLQSAVYDKLDFTKEAFIGLTYRTYPYEIVSLNITVDRDQLLESQTTTDVDTKDNKIIGGSNTIYVTSPITSGIKAIASASPVNTGYDGIVENSSDFANNDDIQSKVDRLLMNNEVMVLTGEMDVLVTPDTNNTYVGDVINLYGLGINLSGGYLVTDISRNVDVSGYSLTFSLAKTGFGGLASIADTTSKEENINDTGATAMEATDQANDNYTDKVEVLYNYEPSVGGNFVTNNTTLYPSSYSIGYVYTIPGMTLFDLTYRLNNNHNWRDGSNLTKDGRIVLLNQFGLMKAIVLNNVEFFSSIIGFETYDTGITQDGVVQYPYGNNHKEMPTNNGMNLLNIFLHTDYTRSWTLPTGTKIQLDLFDGDQIMTVAKADSLLGMAKSSYLTYPRDNYNEEYINAR